MELKEMHEVNISILSLILMSIIPILAIALNYKENLNLTKDILISLVRAIIQLTVLGLVLKIIFNINNIIITLVAVLILILNATINTRKRANFKGSWIISFIAILSSYTILLGGLILFKAIKFIPSQVIPISGMIISNSMVSLNLCYKSLSGKFQSIDQEIIEKLSLGATEKQATKDILVQTISLAVQPTIDSIKVLGIVSIPGMMSGLILAGLNPISAIKYQILVSFLLISTAIFTDSIGTKLSIRFYLKNKNYLGGNYND